MQCWASNHILCWLPLPESGVEWKWAKMTILRMDHQRRWLGSIGMMAWIWCSETTCSDCFDTMLILTHTHTKSKCSAGQDMCAFLLSLPSNIFAWCWPVIFIKHCWFSARGRIFFYSILFKTKPLLGMFFVAGMLRMKMRKRSLLDTIATTRQPSISD